MSNNILCIYIFRKCLETDTKLVHIEVNVPDEELMAAISFCFDSLLSSFLRLHGLSLIN